MKHYLAAAFLFLALSSYAQYPYDAKRDNLWPFGYGGYPGQTNPSFGLTWLSYDTGGLGMRTEYVDIDLGESNAVACDTAGNLLFVTNGIFIFDSSASVMHNCDTLSPGKWAEQSAEAGYILPQGVLALPMPDNENEWVVLHEHMSNLPGSIDVDTLYYTLLDMQQNNGLGAVTSLRNPLLHQKLDYGKLTACRHANGRDWWVIVFNDSATRYCSLLISPNAIQVSTWTSFALPSFPYPGLGQSLFLGDGSKYISYNSIGPSLGEYLEIFDFDRCEGVLSNPQVFYTLDSCGTGGLAASRSGRFIYTSCSDRVYQYDLQAGNIGASQVLVAQWDGFVDPQFPVGTLFYLMGKTPDGKIIICSPNSVHFLHTIESPDSAGLSCNLLQHNIHMVTYNGASMPNYPNFRLGPVDGSACDTLGIDVGIAEPPKQAYNPQPDLEVYPNPASNYCNVGFGSTLKQDGQLVVHNLSGQKVFEAPLQKATIGYTLKVEDWVSGLYLCTLYEGNTEKGSVRFVKE